MIWGSLKNGLINCHLKIRSKILLLLFFLCCLPCWSQSLALSEEELNRIDQIQDPVVLQKIIRMQNQQVIELETTLTLVDQGLIQLTILLRNSDQQLILAYDEVNLLKNQLLILSTSHSTELKTEYSRGFRNGSITFGIIGFSVGGLGGYGIGYAVK